MPVVPTLMVIYTNDAVEVRYSDGSRLQLSPCGSSMYHQDPPSEDLPHPLAGAQGVQKWTQFVTSAHKAKVIQALDFRNRFAHRPFLCSSLIPPEDIVSLYAKIDKIAWPKTPKETNIEVFGDGSRRAVSSDEYASLVLSPHGQDFTVCYLSHISTDARDARNQSEPHQQLWSDQNYDQDQTSFVKDPKFDDDSQQCHRQSQGAGDEKNADDPRNTTPENDQGIHDSGHQCESLANLNINCNNSARGAGIEEVTLDASGVILSDGTVSTPGRTAQQGDLQSSAICSIHHDISSISRVSTPDGLRGMVDCDVTLPQSEETVANPPPPSAAFLHSSPLSLANTQSHTGEADACTAGEDAGRKVSSQRQCSGIALKEAAPVQGLLPGARTSTPQEDCTIKSAHSSEDHSGADASNSSSERNCGATGDAGTLLKSSSHSLNADKACQTLPHNKGETSSSRADNQVPFCNNAMQPQPCPQTHSKQAHLDPQELRTGFAQGKGSRQVGGKGLRSRGDGLEGGVSETWSATRQHYTWVTQHISCSGCPSAWRHPLRMLQTADPTDSVLVSECNLTVSSNIAKTASAVDADQSVFSTVAVPLPLSCPFQHLHAWQPYHHDDEGQGQGLSEFKQGQFHVIMMEGVVYRFVRLGNMKVVEIYPGDGSVFVSQGITAHFFSHIVWKGGKLEEKTYSVKMLPPNIPKSPYSIEKLIKRGHRFLTGCMHSAAVSDKEELPCWKHAPMQVVEPLSTSVLEECSVPGYGRFTAYSNGRIRVVFEDRTALDMVADFSQRLKGCLKHSDYSQHSTAETLAGLKVTSFDQQLSGHRCRLLLPTGKYVIAEVHRPGAYRRYVDAAKEWINWVQSSPTERRQFYQHKAAHQSAHLSAEAELKKIECFNYIVDHSGISSTGASQDSSDVSPPSHMRSTVIQQAPSDPRAVSSTHHFHHIPPVHTSQHSTRHLAVSHGPQYSTRYPDLHAAQYQTAPLGFDLQGSSIRHGLMPSGIPSMSDPKGLELAQGFNSVREALLRTSQMIKDIDDIVKERKKTM